MGVDYNEFKKFVENYEHISQEFDSFMQGFLQKNALEVLAKTKLRTPVDTGDLRKHWFLTDVRRDGNKLVIEICNDMEYATYVEYGHLTKTRDKWVNGYFMVTVPLDEVERKMPRRFQSEFEKFVRRLGG